MTRCRIRERARRGSGRTEFACPASFHGGHQGCRRSRYLVTNVENDASLLSRFGSSVSLATLAA